VLDLMIHDLDIILWLVESPVVEIRAVGIPILTPKIDIANARLAFANGCVANVTASRISRDKVRKLRLFQPGAYISLDYTEQAAEVFRLVPPAEPGGRPSIINANLALPRYEPLRAQIESFIECVKEKKPPLVSGHDGRAALDLALKIIANIQEHTRHEKIS
jgi:predicted dehydrogenase